MIILDTNVLSELMRSAPASKVVRWISGRPTSSYYTTSITESEILLGIHLLPAGRRKEAFETAALALFEEEFAGRVIPFGSDAASCYAQIASHRQHSGQPISHFDAQIAAIAKSADATLATRNVSDFEDCGIRVVDPWR
jgi:toxin FitB